MTPTDPPPDAHHEAAERAREKARRAGTRTPSVSTGAKCSYEYAEGKVCTRDAGWGTEHPGVGPCKSHDKGWAAMRGDTKVQKYARPLLAKLTGYDVNVNPMDALLMCVRIAAAEVAYFTERMDMLGEDAMTMRPSVTRSTVKDKGGTVEKTVVRVEENEELNLWMKARRESLRDLARYSKMALEAGVEERMVRVAETVGESIATAVRGILDDLKLDKQQQEVAPEIVRRHLRRIVGGQAA